MTRTRWSATSCRLDRSLTRREMMSERETLHGKLPTPGETAHFVNNANFDYWNAIAEIALILSATRPVTEFYGSTWSINRQNIQELMLLLDTGKILKCAFLTDRSLKRRDNASYAQIVIGLQERNQRFVAFNNHTKVTILTDGIEYIVTEGSANWTANPRLEQFTVTNSRDLYDFHRGWMEEMLTHPPKTKLSVDPLKADNL
jgi:hypothetical protein